MRQPGAGRDSDPSVQTGYNQPSNFRETLVTIFFLIAVAYSVGTYVFLNNISFTSPRKGMFCFTIIPLFFGMMFVNLWLTTKFAPGLMDGFEVAKAHDQHVREITGHAVRRGQAGPMAFVIATPIAALVSFAWYALVKKWEVAAQKELRAKARSKR